MMTYGLVDMVKIYVSIDYVDHVWQFKFIESLETLQCCPTGSRVNNLQTLLSCNLNSHIVGELQDIHSLFTRKPDKQLATLI
jgi:hypothetical protein